MNAQGEGRLAAATKQLMLGETLPPLLLVLTDAHGNRIEQLSEALGIIEVAVQPADATSPGRAPRLDIQVTSAQVESPPPPPPATPLHLFSKACQSCD